MDANYARKLTEDAQSLQGDFLREETDKILKAIEAAAAKGLNEVWTSSTQEVIQRRLKILGFTVILNRAFDQRDSDSLTVSW